MLRREPFGGILYAPADGTYLELDHAGYAFVREWLAAPRDALLEAEADFLAELQAEIPALAAFPRDYREVDLWREDVPSYRYATVLSSPTLVDLQLTRRCHMGCPHCYAASAPSGEHMPYGELLRILDELAAAGVCQLALGGGEPLLHPHIIAILQRAHALGMVPNLTTTGDGLTPAVLEACARYCGAVALSLEAVGADFALRRRAGFSFFEAARAVLQAAGVRTVFQITLSAGNIEQLPSLVEYCLSCTELYGVIFLAYKPVGRGAAYDRPLAALGPHELYPRLRAAFLRLSEHTRVGYDCCLTPGLAGIDLELGCTTHDLLEGCSAARSSVGITPELDVVPCTFLTHRPLGNLRRESFLSIWQGAAAHAFRAQLDARGDQEPACQRCPSRAGCLGGCPEWNLITCSVPAAALGS